MGLERVMIGISLIIVSVLVGLPACSQDRAPDGNVPVELHDEETHEPHEGEEPEAQGMVSFEEAERLGTVTVEPAGRRALTSLVSATGEVASDPDRVAHLTSRVAGWIHEVRVFQEDTVKKGTLLATIDSPNYLTAQTEYLMAVRRSQSPPPPEGAKTAEALLASTRQKLLILGAGEADIQALHSTQTQQRYLPIRAPRHGTVIESRVVNGNAVQPGESLYRIADLSTVWVLLNIQEQDLPAIRQGAAVRVTTAGYPETEFQGTLVLLSQTAQEATRTVQARVVVKNPKGQLRPGMFVRGKIENPGGDQVLAVPASAVFLYDGRPVVFVRRAEGYQAVAVRAGRELGGWVEIIDGIPDQTSVVVDGGFSLKAQLMKESMGAGHGH